MDLGDFWQAYVEIAYSKERKQLRETICNAIMHCFTDCKKQLKSKCGPKLIAWIVGRINLTLIKSMTQVICYSFRESTKDKYAYLNTIENCIQSMHELHEILYSLYQDVHPNMVTFLQSDDKSAETGLCETVNDADVRISHDDVRTRDTCILHSQAIYDTIGSSILKYIYDLEQSLSDDCSYDNKVAIRNSILLCLNEVLAIMVISYAEANGMGFDFFMAQMAKIEAYMKKIMPEIYEETNNKIE